MTLTPPGSGEWYVDSGAGSHMVNNAGLSMKDLQTRSVIASHVTFDETVFPFADMSTSPQDHTALDFLDAADDSSLPVGSRAVLAGTRLPGGMDAAPGSNGGPGPTSLGGTAGHSPGGTAGPATGGTADRLATGGHTTDAGGTAGGTADPSPSHRLATGRPRDRRS
ncbi:uncharacterized protein [Miscanthus floridulus]|uniref:uncharacterized protein n=1 Tax=Miscanthus floridulus TaxID=154761 RepID=UPI00345B3047